MQKNSPSYSYSKKPKELTSGNCNRVKQIVKSGNASKLERIVRDGRGYYFIGEFSSDPRIRSLLKSVPFYMARIDMLHDAVTEGRLRDLQILLDTTSPVFAVLKPKAENLVSCKDNAGVGLLHKAVYYDHPHIVEWLIQNYPATMQLRDKMGRIALHYVNSMTDPEGNWRLLVEHGSPVDVKDVNGRTPRSYLNADDDIHLPGRVHYSELHDEGIVIKPSNLRIWIHDQDLTRLREVILLGFGDKLESQTSNKTKMKKFLNAVPYVMDLIREIHKAAIENDVNILTTLCLPPVPAVILKSKDDKGITSLHKACGLGNSEVVAYILQTYPEAIYIRDNEGRTPIHYAAIFGREQVYETLLRAGANEHIIDKKGKTAKYYRHKTDSKQDAELLYKLPNSPHTGLGLFVLDTDFDWSVFGWSNSQPDAAVPTIHIDATWTTEASSDDESPPSQLSGSPADTGDRIDSRPVTSDADQEATRSSNENPLCDPQTPLEQLQFTDQAVSRGIESSNSSGQGNEASDESECSGGSDTTMPCVDAESEAEKSEVPVDLQLAHPDSENGTSYSVRDILCHRTMISETELKVAIENILRNENLEEIGELILAGYGEWLFDVRSQNPTIQELVRHLPIYLKKIELIHRCCEIGNVEELRKYLDRRKLAVAREPSTQLFVTPLHVAVARNRMQVVRYLGGRFPETLHQPDKLGRTPLHYAAMCANGKFAYHTLLTLGANKHLEDYNGHSAQFYYDNPEEGYRQELTDIVQKLKSDFAKRDVETKRLSIMEELAFDPIESNYLISGIIDGQPISDENEMSIGAEVGESEVLEPEARESAENVPPAHFDEHQSERLQSSAHAPTQEESVSTLNYDPGSNIFLPMSRDKYGRTAIHLAASKIQSRNSLLQMLHDLKANVAYRDELYRTARDIAALCQVYENVKAIDTYVVNMAANGENDKIINLLTDGYDHILETETEENILTVVERRDHQTTLTILKTVLVFEDIRERLHSAVRRGDKLQVMETLRKCGKDAALMAVSKNEWCRCCLHIAVLAQRKDIVIYLTKKFPTTLHIGDNLERTPLHYAMALDKVEEFSTILIRGGAQRTAKDLKGRQPTYYFVNKEEIIRMQDEEIYMNQNMENRPRRKS